MKLHTATSLVAAFEARHAQPGTADIQAGADDTQYKDPDFGGEVSDIHAAGVLSFNGAGKTVTAKALSHFGVLGSLVKEGELVELPEADFKRMGPNGSNQVVEATDDDVAAAQKATKAK